MTSPKPHEFDGIETLAWVLMLGIAGLAAVVLVVSLIWWLS